MPWSPEPLRSVTFRYRGVIFTALFRPSYSSRSIGDLAIVGLEDYSSELQHAAVRAAEATLTPQGLVS